MIDPNTQAEIWAKQQAMRLRRKSVGNLNKRELTSDDERQIGSITGMPSSDEAGGIRGQKWLNLQTPFQKVVREVLEELPPSRERSLALTKLEEAVMWAWSAVEKEDVWTDE